MSAYSYLQTLFPLIVCGVSLLYLLIQLYQTATASKQHHAYKPLNTVEDVWANRAPQDNDDAEAEAEVEDDFDGEEHLALHPTLSRQTMSTIAVNKPRGEITVVALEELAVLAELGLHAA